MGSKRLGRVRENVVAAVKAGTMKAADAYNSLSGGGFTRGEFEILQRDAARSKLGLWRDAPESERKAAASYGGGLAVDTPSKVEQRANALGMDVREYSAAPLGRDGKPLNANNMPDQPTNVLATKPSGYALQGGATAAGPNAARIAELETERDGLTRTSNAMGGLSSNQARIDEINRELTTMMQAPGAIGSGRDRAAPTGTAGGKYSLPAEPSIDQHWTDATFDAPVTPIKQVAPLGQTNPMPVDYSNMTTGSAAATAALNNLLNNPAEREKLLAQIAANDAKKSVADQLMNRDPNPEGTRVGVPARVNGIEPSLESQLPSPTIGSPGIGTNESVAKAVADVAASGGSLALQAQAAKSAAIAGGASVDGANKVAFDVLLSKGVSVTEATQIIARTPATLAGSTGAPVAGYGSPAPGVTSNGVTGVDGIAPGPEQLGPALPQQGPPVAPPVPSATTTPAAPSSPLTNGGTGTGPTPAGAPPPTPPGGTVPPVVPPVDPTGGAVPLGFDPMTGIIAATGLTQAGAALWVGNEQARAAREAATLQSNAATADRTLQESQYNQFRHDSAPWRAAGEEALGYTQDAAGNWQTRPSGGLRTFEQDNPQFKVDPFKFDMDARSPAYNKAYDFRLSEGMKALQNSAAAKGMLRSGNTMQAITKYGQDMASQEVDNEFGRYNTNKVNDFNIFNTQRGSKLNALQSLAGNGQSAVNTVGNAGQNYANQSGQAGMNAANAQAGGITGAANASAGGWVGGVNALSQALGQGINYSNQQNTNAQIMNYLQRGR